MSGGLGGLMKQAREMQAKLQKAQEALATMEVTGESGGGMVKVVMNGRHDARRVSIDASLLGEREMLEDLITAAINDAERKVEAQARDHLAGLTGGLNLPADFKLPF